MSETIELPETRVDPKLYAIAQRLEEMIPLFAEYRPQGWIDFRDKELSKAWRGGTYLKSGAPEGMLVLRGMFGCESLARLAASQFSIATEIQARAESFGEQSDMLWQVTIKIPLDEVNW